MKKLVLLVGLTLMTFNICAQRMTDKLDRGLVATVAQKGSGVFLSWRIFAEEYYDVTYNLYCDGSKIASDLRTSNYLHEGGNAGSRYQVAPVVRGVEGEKCAPVTRWENSSNYGGINTGYLDVPMQSVQGRDGSDITADFSINDISLGDVTGNGVSELIVKRISGKAHDRSQSNSYHHMECYDISGKRLWWIDLGPNMISGPDEQFDAVAYDWDEDGKAEVIMRGADNMIIHQADGRTVNVGDMTKNYGGGEYVNQGAEFLLYLNGSTGEPYVIMDYPLPRYEVGETDDLLGSSAEGEIWGNGILGHRPTKHYFGAPVLDGRHASIFLGRGCYTRHKMCALDVNPTTHQLTQRWRWNEYEGGSPYFGQGFHNFAIADVDWDGRDEIVFGSMVIDDNGKGLSTTGLGHGDAQHCSDLDPFRHGQEQFTCNETAPAMAYRDATTSKMYFRVVSGADDGRALAGNFSNQYPGSIGASTQSGIVSCTSDRVIPGAAGMDLNSRIYWDGDLLEEILNSPGVEREAKIDKHGMGRLFLSSGCQMNNSSKNNPCAIGDIFGDWREELLLRSGSAYVRIYTSNYPTEYRIPTLWHDHQYRQGMVWQMMGYNQPPHASFFVGELEGITMAPPPYTMTGRTEIADGGSITAAHNGQQVMVCATSDTRITVADGAQPWVAWFNVPSWVQGTNSKKTDGTADIIRKYYHSTVTGGAFSGSMRLVKQGDGALTLPAVEQKHTGNTDIWAGTLNFDGKMLQSPLWLNRFAELNSNGGQFRSIRMSYDAKLRPGGADSKGGITVDTLHLGYGARIVFDLYEDISADAVNAKVVSFETKDWQYGPKYMEPVFEFVCHNIVPGRYPIGYFGKLSGNLSDVAIEGISNNLKRTLELDDDGMLWINLSETRQPASIVWNGNQSAVWDLAGAENFTLEDVTNEVFVNGDKVTFDDSAAKRTVTLKGELDADSVIFEGAKNYTLSGRGAITGGTTLVKRGKGGLTIRTDNTFTGGVRLSGGTTIVNVLSNSTQTHGGLGAQTTQADKFIIENGAELRTNGAVRLESPIRVSGTNGGVINRQSGFTMNSYFSGTKLTIKGPGLIQTYVGCPGLDTLVIQAGAMDMLGHNTPAKKVILEGGSLRETTIYTVATYPLIIPAKKSATYYLAERCGYNNKITGKGTLTVVCPPTLGAVARTAFGSNLADFEGTFVTEGTADWRFFIFDNVSVMTKGTLQIGDNVEVKNSGKVMTLGRVKGDNGKLGGFDAAGARIPEGPNTWKIGNETDWTWGGIVTSNSNLTKVGTGKATLNGASNHTGTTDVEAGELHFGNNATLGTGALTVKKDATLSGVTSSSTGLTNSYYIVQNGGTIQVGTTSASYSGIINFGGKNIVFNKGSVLKLGMSGKATATSTGGCSLGNIKTITMNGIISLKYSRRFSVAAGDSVVLWKATSCIGTPVLENDTINAEKGLYWDTSDIRKGILRVVYREPTAIREITAAEEDSDGNEDDNAPVYTIDGRRLSATSLKGLPRGIYIKAGRKYFVK